MPRGKSKRVGVDTKRYTVIISRTEWPSIGAGYIHKRRKQVTGKGSDALAKYVSCFGTHERRSSFCVSVNTKGC